MEYTLTLQSNRDYQILKKLLKAFEGATITPVRRRKTSVEVSLDEARQGKVQGPFDTVDTFMKNLME